MTTLQYLTRIWSLK